MNKEETILKLTTKREDLILSYDTAKPLPIYELLTSFEKSKDKFFINEKQDILYKKNDSILSVDKKGIVSQFVIHKDILRDMYYEILSITEAKLATECSCGECNENNIEVVPILNEDIIKELKKGNKLLFIYEEIEGEIVLREKGLSVKTNVGAYIVEAGYMPEILLEAFFEGHWEKVINKGGKR